MTEEELNHEARMFRAAVLDALQNCWGVDYPTKSDEIAKWLEREWRRRGDAEQMVDFLKRDLKLLKTIVLNMAASIYGPQRETQPTPAQVSTSQASGQTGKTDSTSR